MSNRKIALSRRDFAKSAALAGSFAIAASPSGVAETNSETLKIGLLGCGGRGGADLVRMLGGNDNVKVIALADLFPDHLERKRKEFEAHKDPGIRAKVDIKDDHCFTGWDAYKGILDTDIDILMECCTPYVRPKHIEAAVEKDIHIFAEKPIAVDPVGVRRFLTAMKKHKAKGLTMMTGTQFRHDKARKETLDKLNNGALGEIVSLRSYYCGSLPFVVERNEGWCDVEYQLRNWYNYCWACGDNIVEQAIHGIDHCNWIMGGPPESVFASGGRTWKPRTEMFGDLYDHFSCDYTYPNGVHLAQYCRHWDGCDGAGGVQIACAKGVSNGQDMSEWSGDLTLQEHKDMVASIRGTGDYLHEAERIANTTITAMMGRESAYTGKRVTFKGMMESDLSLIPEKLEFGMELPIREVPVPHVTPRAALKTR